MDNWAWNEFIMFLFVCLMGGIMVNNFFITGAPQSGKTTLLHDLVKELKKRGFNVGGFLSPEKKEHGTREGFFVQDIETGNIAMLAALDSDGPKVSKYHVDVKGFEYIALQSMKNAGRYDVIIIDEIGVMEMKSTAFQNALTDLLEHEMPIVASLHREYVNMYEIFGRVYSITESNRNEVYASVLRNTLRALENKPAVKRTEVQKLDVKIAKKAITGKKRTAKKIKRKKPASKKHVKKIMGRKGKRKKQAIEMSSIQAQPEKKEVQKTSEKKSAIRILKDLFKL